MENKNVPRISPLCPVVYETHLAQGLAPALHRQAGTLAGTAGRATMVRTTKWHQTHPHLQQARPELTTAGGERHYSPHGARRKDPTALSSAQLWVSHSHEQGPGGCSGSWGGLSNVLLGREGRAVVSARCARQLFSTSASSDPAIGHKTLCFTSVFFWEWHDTKQSPTVLQGHTHTHTKSNCLLVPPSNHSQTLTTDCSFVDSWLLPVLTCAIAFWSPTRQSTVWKDVHMKARVNSKTSVPGCEGAEFNISKTYRKGQCIMEVEGDGGGACRGRG